MRDEVSVLIVGGGPVGLALAGDLGWRGIECLVVEQLPELRPFPTTMSVNARTLEFCRRWGFVDRVEAVSEFPGIPRVVKFVTNLLTGFELASVEHSSHEKFNQDGASPTRNVWCPNVYFEPLLYEHARSYRSADVRFGWRFDSFEQDEASVTSVITHSLSGRREVVRSGYLIACDGGASGVRRSLAVRLEGDFAEGQNLNVFFRARGLMRAIPHGPAYQYWMTGKGARLAFMTIDGRDFWRGEVRLKPGERPADFNVHSAFLTAFGREFPLELVGRREWTGHKAVAERYRVGRVFFAGDAAHLNWPSGGFGMNTGIGDAVDLGWKLDATIRGWGGRALLDTYETERRPVALRNVSEASANYHLDIDIDPPEEIADPGPEGERLRAEYGCRIAAFRSREWKQRGVVLGYRYDRSPIVIADGAPAPEDRLDEYTPTTTPGARAPHLWLRDGRSILDLFGRGFTLLVLDASADPGGIAEAAAARSVPLTIEHVPEAYEVYKAALVLVRPDGHVAWRSDRAPGEPRWLIDRVRGAG